MGAQGLGAVIINLLIASLVVFVPAVAGLGVSRLFRARSKPVQVIFALGVPCLLGYITFGFYLISPSVGRVAAVILGSLTLAAIVLWILLDYIEAKALLRVWVVPAGMTITAAVFSLGLGFLHGSLRIPWSPRKTDT